MKLSIIIPVYNCAQFLERCLDSVLSQRLDDGDELQIITVDDGSTDGSGAILDRYATEHCNIQVIHQPNQGVSAARNHALDVAEGDYIHFVDGDDFLIYNNSYQKLLVILKSAETPIDVLYIDYVSFYEDYAVQLDQYKDLGEIEIDFDGSGRECCHQLFFRGFACGSITRRELIEELNLRFDPNVHLSEDALFNLELYNYAKRVVITQAPVYGYYRHSSSATYTKDKKKLRAVIDAMFDNLPPTIAVLDLYDDPFFKQYRMKCHGCAIAKRLLRVPLPFGAFRSYIKRGFKCGVFPVRMVNYKYAEMCYNFLLKHPLLFWLFSFIYRYVFLSVVRPLMIRIGKLLFR